jgi:hypothetical protein
MKRYFVRKVMGDIEHGVDAENYLSRTVYEADPDLIDIGVMDADGNPIYAANAKAPIGFVHHKEKP